MATGSPDRGQMSPDASWVKWLVILAALVQAVAAVIQVSQVRRRTGGNESPKSAIPIDEALRVGVAAVVVGIVVLPIVPARLEAAKAPGLPVPEAIYAAILIFGPFAVGFVGAWVALEKILNHDKTATELFVHSLTAGASALVGLMAMTALWP